MKLYRVKQSTFTQAVVFGVILSAAWLIFALVLPNPVQAAGGVGGGGSGTGGGGGSGHWTSNGWGWAQYNVSGNGPRDGFKDGTSWGSIKSTCNSADASTVIVNIVMDEHGEGRGYDYKNSWEGLPGRFTNGANVDGGRATAISTATAKNRFNKLGEFGVNTSGYTFGNNVAWFCYNFAPQDTPPEGTLALNCNRVGWRNVRDVDSPGNATSVLLRIKKGGPGSSNPWIQIYESGARKKGDDNFHRNSSWPADSVITAELRIRNITPENQVNGDGAKVRTKSTDCREPVAALNCDRLALNNGTRPGNWSSLVQNSRNLRILIWTANTPFGGEPGQLHPGKESGTHSGWHYGIKDHDFASFSFTHSLTQGEGGYNLQRSGNVYAQIRVFQKANNGDNDNWDNWALRDTYRYSASGNPCYLASCQINVGVPAASAVPARPSAAKATRPIDINIVVRNIGGNVWGAPIQVRNEGANSNGWNFARDDDSGGIGPGGDAEFYYSAAVSSTAGVNHMNVHPSFWWLDQINSSPGARSLCGNSINVYQPFNLTPVADSLNLEPQDENPNNVRLISRVVANPTFEGIPTMPVGATATRTITRNGANLPPGPWSTHQAHHSRNYNDTAPVTPTVGDTYCGRIRISPAQGWAHPGGDRVDLVGALETNPTATCDIVKNNPYMRAYHTDVLAGGAFEGEGNCSSGGGISSYAYPSYRGSGVQFAALAISAINGFTSASVRNDGAPTMPTGLTFANTTGGFGGWFGGINCATNFFDSTQDDPTPDNTPSVSGSGQTMSNTNVTLPGGSVNGKRTIYVDGNVYITGNITLSGGGSDVEALPNFSLIVRGNIYISPNVSRLDGLYVAQSRDGVPNSSRIYTCATGLGHPVSDSGLWTTCGGPEGENNDPSGQLVVNGAFIADQVHLLRTYKTLRNSSVREGYSGNAAEVFRLSPDTYLSIPAFKQTEGGSLGPPDSIKILPPIL